MNAILPHVQVDLADVRHYGGKAAIFIAISIEKGRLSGRDDGWWHYTMEEIERDTGFTKSAVRKIRETLKEAGLLEEVRKGLPARLYFRLIGR